MIAVLMAADSGLVVSATSEVSIDPPPGTPITDPSVSPVLMGLGHEPDAEAAFDSPTVLFVNFDGPLMNGGCGNDSHDNCSTLFPDVQFLPSPSNDAKRAAVIQAIREDVADFGVIVVGERPPQNNTYAMVVVGTPDSGPPGSIGGVAPGIDCGNNTPNLTSFSFAVEASTNTQATVIQQEAAHTWGLEHVNDSTDNLFPAMGGVFDPEYQDTCSRVVADAELTPVPSSCNTVHTMFCPDDQQNSYREMLLLFGPPIPDEVAPSVIIESPTEGEQIEYADDFGLTVTLDDDRRPQVLDTHVFFDGVEEASAQLIDATLTFPVNGGDPPGGHGLSNGPHVIRVDITDEAGNPASAEVTIEIVGSPFGDPDGLDVPHEGGSDGADDSPEAGGDDEGASADPMERSGTGQGCGCRTSAPPGWTPGVLLFVLGGIRRRRRGTTTRPGRARRAAAGAALAVAHAGYHMGPGPGGSRWCP